MAVKAAAAAGDGHAPARLRWHAPEDAPRPDWLDACAAAFDALEVGATPDASAPGPAVHVHLGPVPSQIPDAGACHWWLTDGQGRALHAQQPLLEDITASSGLALALWARHPKHPSWVCLRRLHVDADSHYAVGRQGLPAAVARLVAQALTDLRLGVAPSNHVYPSPRATAPDAGPKRNPGQRLPRLALLLRGRWQAWLARQRARWWREEWRIGVIDAPLAALAGPKKLPPPRWLLPYSGLGYWADPTAVAGSDSRILAEYFDEVSGLGRIEQLRLNHSSDVTDRKVLPLGGGGHASFPMAVQLEGRWLGLAETVALRACELHEIDAQGQWRPLATLLPGTAAADPALFIWQGRYWLACTDVDQGASDNLCLFHAQRPEGPWTPHANNPVKVDVRGARMAGAFFWHRGELYRPAQNCLGSYGASVVLHRIVRCSPNEFEEEAVRTLMPDPSGPCPHGLHTVNAWGNRTLVDGKRHVFSLPLGWLKLRRRLARQTSA